MIDAFDVFAVIVFIAAFAFGPIGVICVVARISKCLKRRRQSTTLPYVRSEAISPEAQREVDELEHLLTL